MENYTETFYDYGEFIKEFFKIINVYDIEDGNKVSFTVNDGWDYLIDKPYYCNFIHLDKIKESNFFNIMMKTRGTIASYKDDNDLYIWVEGVSYDPNELAEYFPDGEKGCVNDFFSCVDTEEDSHDYVGYDSGCGCIDTVVFPLSVIDSLHYEYSEELNCYLIYDVSGNVMTAESGEVATEEYFENNSDYEDIGGDDEINYCNIYSSEYDIWEEENRSISIYDYHNYDKGYECHSLGDEKRSKRTGNHLFMGTELEVDNTQIENSKLAENALYMLDSSDNIMFHCEHDGSVEFEFISQPMTYDYRADNFSNREKEALNYLKDYCTSHNSGTCGLHVHVNKSFFNDDSYKKLKTILEFFKVELFAFSRRQSLSYHYASFIESGIDGDDEQPSDKMLEYRKDMNNVKPSKINKKELRGHSYWYNEDSGNTFEFRMFRGTLKFTTIMATLQLVRNICFLADSDKNTITWDDIVKGCEDSKYCENYCIERGITGDGIVLEYDKAIECENKSFDGKCEKFKQEKEKCIMMFEYLCQHTWFTDGNIISDFRIKYNESMGQLELFATSFEVKDGVINGVARMDEMVSNWHVVTMDTDKVFKHEELLDYEIHSMKNMYKNMNDFVNSSESNPKWVFKDALIAFAESYSGKNSFEVVNNARKQG